MGKHYKQKKEEGLGIRETRKVNIARLVKLEGKMDGGSNSLWACVLRNKYIKDNDVMECGDKNMDSHMWKGIVKCLNRIK